MEVKRKESNVDLLSTEKERVIGRLKAEEGKHDRLGDTSNSCDRYASSLSIFNLSPFSRNIFSEEVDLIQCNKFATLGTIVVFMLN